MPKAKVNGWKCSKCGHEWCLKKKSLESDIIICSDCQNKEVNTY